jgi:molybdate transport system ATP-binding protein
VGAEYRQRFFLVCYSARSMVSSSARRRSRYIRVDLQHVRLALAGKPVLRGVSWSVQPTQRWVLLGPNGAGKTQLLKLLAGDVWPTPSRASRREYRLAGESYAEPYDIKGEIAYLGAERQDRYEHYGWNHRVEAIVGTGIYRTDIPLDPLTVADRVRIRSVLRKLGIESLAGRRFLRLSYGERRLVLLARALASRPKLLLLDELFNGLDAVNRARVQRCLRGLSRSSLPWVLSTHRALDIPPQATHLCRLVAGRIVARRALTSRSAATRSTRVRGAAAIQAKASAGPALVTLRRVNVWREGVAVLRNLNLSIGRGQCWIVHGANGSGKSSFLQLLYGDLSAAHGGHLGRAGIESGVPLEQFKRRVGLVAPELQALHPRYLRVEEVVASGQYASIGLNDSFPGAVRSRIALALRLVGAAGLADRAVRTLSYGQLRRVLFARALAHEPDMLLLDEPYAGVDAATRKLLRTLVRREWESGVTIVMVTHHREEWPSGATHELELRQSRVIYCGPVRQ